MAISATQKWYAGAAAASVGVLAAGWFLLVSPQQSNAEDINAQADRVAVANQAAESQIAQLKAQYSDLPSLQSKIASIRTRIPQTPDEPSLLRQISKVAKASGVTLVSIQLQTPGVIASGQAGAAAAKGDSNPLSAPGAVSSIPISMQVEGTFANTRLFLNAVEGMQRAMLVTGLDISRSIDNTTGAVSLTTNVSSAVFMANPGGIVAPPASSSASVPVTNAVSPS